MPSLNTGNAILSNAIAVDSSYNVGIGGAASGSFKLQVTGTSNLTGALTGTSATFSGNGAFSGVLQVAPTTSTGMIGVGDNFGGGMNAGIYRGGLGVTTSGNYLNVGGYDGVVITTGNAALGSQTVRLTIASNGAATFSNTGSASYGLTVANSSDNLRLRLGTTTGGYLNIQGQITSSGNPFNISLQADGGNVGIGTTTPAAGYLLDVYGTATFGATTTTGDKVHIGSGAVPSGAAGIGMWATGGNLLSIVGLGDTTIDARGSLLIVNPNGGNVLIGTSSIIGAAGGAIFQLAQSNANWIHYIENTASSGAVYGSSINFKNQAPNNNISAFFAGGDSSVERYRMYANGGLANYQANNVNLSDERTKKDITPLESYWDKFKAIEIVKFKYKDQTHEDFNIGVIAQQVEAVAPEFIDADGWNTKKELDEEGNEILSNEEPLKSVYTSDLHHATIKVLQEAMARIEEQQAQIEELKAIVATK
jgi:hypothetical protein